MAGLNTTLPEAILLGTGKGKDLGLLRLGDVSEDKITAIFGALPDNLKDLPFLFQESGGKSHKHINIKQIEKMTNGGEFFKPVCQVIEPLLRTEDGKPIYCVHDCELVIRYGDSYPFHQDKRTGAATFTRDSNLWKKLYKDGISVTSLPNAIRLLLDFTPNKCRQMIYRRQGTEEVLFTSESRLTGMN